MPEPGEFSHLIDYSKRPTKLMVARYDESGELKPTKYAFHDEVTVEITNASYYGFPEFLKPFRVHRDWVCDALLAPDIPCLLYITTPKPTRAHALEGMRVKGKIVSERGKQLILESVQLSPDVDPGQAAEVSATLGALEEIQKHIRSFRRPIVDLLQQNLGHLEGVPMTEEQKSALVESLQSVFRDLGVGVICPKTKQVGTIRLKRAGRNRQLVFEIRVWEHGRRTSHFSSSVFPRVELGFLPDNQPE